MGHVWLQSYADAMRMVEAKRRLHINQQTATSIASEPKTTSAKVPADAKSHHNNNDPSRAPRALVVNCHHKQGYSEGRLNASLAEQAAEHFINHGYDVKQTVIEKGYDVVDEKDKFFWADVILFQSPVYWMGLPWLAKKYVDETYFSYCHSDGRHSDSPQEGYGTGGLLAGKKYMLSVTTNAPAGAFGRPEQYLFQGRSVDDLWFPFHMNQRFSGMQSLPTFVCHDVMKNPQIQSDFDRFAAHLRVHFPKHNTSQ